MTKGTRIAIAGATATLGLIAALGVHAPSAASSASKLLTVADSITSGNTKVITAADTSTAVQPQFITVPRLP